MTIATVSGYPRIGLNRELKKAEEAYWKGKISADELQATAKDLRKRHWTIMQEAGLDHIPCNDFSFYDQVLDMACLLGCIPERYNFPGSKTVDLDTYFAMARGEQTDKRNVTAMEMTKWYDTNYHYIVPEFAADQTFRIASTKIFDEFAEALEAGIKNARPVLIGPATFLSLGKPKDEFAPMTLMAQIVPVYIEILKRLQNQGAQWVQMDEPCLALDLAPGAAEALTLAYDEITASVPGLNICLNTYFEGLRENTALTFSLPVQAVHVDLVRAPDQLDACILEAKKTGKILGLGLIDGRNVWRTDLEAALEKAGKAANTLGTNHVMIGASCSLLHVPFDLEIEKGHLDEEVYEWMAYARQKLDEIVTLAKGVADGRDAVAAEIAASQAAVKSRRESPRLHNLKVRARTEAVDEKMLTRENPFSVREDLQKSALNLPLFPTTSIGSFPQTPEIRKARAAHKKGEMAEDAYQAAMKKEIETVVRFQEEIGMDVLVHGEPERNDMVEYFGEQLSGFVFTKNGWVQSYGSRCVKPPVIFGDVERPAPMTVPWSAYAQSLTDKPMKGMLTGPITILQWSFVRDDQPRAQTCAQIALAIRDEVVDLEAAGIAVIQIDEPAIREGLPLRDADRAGYLRWAVDSFRLSASGVGDKTQIHTHMCYSEFNDIIDSIAEMDADVISIETSRSQMELLDAFIEFDYPNEIGPGVYDIHSPRVPDVQEMVRLLEQAASVLKPEQIWVNPDCGLKTRGWEEVRPALKNMVAAAKTMRERA